MNEEKLRSAQITLEWCDRGILCNEIYARNTNTDINDAPSHKEFVYMKTITLRMLKLNKIKSKL